MIPKMSFIISWLGKLSGNCNLLVGMGEDAKCCGKTEISTELLGAGRLLVGDSAVF